MTKITDNFTFEELIHSAYAEKYHIPNLPSKEEHKSLVRLAEAILQPIRNSFGSPIKVTSGYRSSRVNSAVGGSRTSQHVKGEAADITSSDNKKLMTLITCLIKDGKIEVGQVINEFDYSWIHISLPSKTHHNEVLRAYNTKKGVRYERI